MIYHWEHQQVLQLLQAVSINAISSSTNVTASAFNLVTFGLNFANLPSASQVSINGSTVDFSSTSDVSSVMQPLTMLQLEIL